MVSPKGLKPKKDHEIRAPKPMKEKKKEKEKRSKSENGRRTNVKELNRDPQRLEFSEAYSTAKTGLKQLKGKHQRNTRNKEQIRPSQVSEIQQEKGRKPKVTSHNAKGTVPQGTRTRSCKKGSSSKKLSNQQRRILPTQEK